MFAVVAVRMSGAIEGVAEDCHLACGLPLAPLPLAVELQRLGTADRQSERRSEARVEVEVFPAQAEEFALSEYGVESRLEQCV
ncbi:hypothetical protein [Streptomyces sp. NPDC048551]|uniref:hypothetical protein n=1 Tax=Streptomyces sp. NPDC048551 TaxID=3155758 RepID=UPI003445F655